MLFEKEIKEFYNNNLTYITLETSSEEKTFELAKEFAKVLNSNDIISLNGELGSGKTSFMKGLAKYFNIETDVSSPTFTIVNEYSTNNFPIYHFDVYRLNDSTQFENTIGTDYFYNGLCIIEWGKIIEDILPKNSILIDIEKIGETKRKFNIRRKLI